MTVFSEEYEKSERSQMGVKKCHRCQLCVKYVSAI